MARAGAFAAALALASCVPSGNATHDGGAPTHSQPTAERFTPPPHPSAFFRADEPLRGPFEDTFDRPALRRGGQADSATGDHDSTLSADLGPDWAATAPGIWHIEEGRLCGEHARNHGVWLKRVLPADARIEFDAVSDSRDGDIKAESWGDGRSFATALSYTNATSYITILGGWHNRFDVLARLNEHGSDRKEIVIDPQSDDPREKPVFAGQIYHFKIERTDGKTVRWSVDGNEMLSYSDPAPLEGPGHDHFGFNDWDVKLCFDNVRIVPLP